MVSIDAVLLSVALGIDAAVVAFAIGLAHPDKGQRPGLILATWFGGFQALMALLGWSAVHYVAVLRPWALRGSALIFILLGAKLLWDVFHDVQDERTKVPTQHHEFLLLAVATSIDSLAAGVGLITFAHPFFTIGLIGLVAFLMTWGGALLSRRLRQLPEAWAEGVGAVILIFLGVKSLVW